MSLGGLQAWQDEQYFLFIKVQARPESREKYLNACFGSWRCQSSRAQRDKTSGPYHSTRHHVLRDRQIHPTTENREVREASGIENRKTGSETLSEGTRSKIPGIKYPCPTPGYKNQTFEESIPNAKGKPARDRDIAEPELKGNQACNPDHA